MTLFLRLRRATLLLTRGMERSLPHWRALQTGLVGVRHERGLAEVPLPLGMLLGQDVALVRVIAAQPASSRQLDANWPAAPLSRVQEPHPDQEASQAEAAPPQAPARVARRRGPFEGPANGVRSAPCLASRATSRASSARTRS